MGIKETFSAGCEPRRTRQEELEDAEADEATREYSAERADTVAGFELGGGRGDFESDQEAPGMISFTDSSQRRASLGRRGEGAGRVPVVCAALVAAVSLRERGHGRGSGSRARSRSSCAASRSGRESGSS